MSPRLIAWIGRNIMPHEAELRGWLRKTFPAIDTDDLVQEAYCRLAALENFEHVRDPRLYLFQTARNVAREQIRRSRVVRIEAATGLAEFVEAPDCEAASPERIVADRRMLSRVEELIASLSARGSEICRMRKIEGLSQRQIAEMLGITETVVENEVARGLRKILSAMTEDERSSAQIRRKGRRDENGQHQD